MPIPPARQFTSWSYSRLRDYEQCPLRARYKYLDRRKEPDHPAQARGSRVHADAVAFVLGRVRSLPKKLGEEPHPLLTFKSELAELRRQRRHVCAEHEVALDAAWEPTDWFESDALKNGRPAPWLRVKLDFRLSLDGGERVIDVKTGKVRDTDREQLELYAAAGFADADGSVETIDAALWYVDQGEEVPATFRRRDVPRLRAKWLKRIASMFRDRRFKPRPGDYCRWCHFRKSNGGPCRY